MKSVKLISRLLFYVTRLLAILYSLVTLYSLFCILSGYSVEYYNNGNDFHIHYPFTNIPFLNIDNNSPTIIFDFLLPIFLYSLFFLLTSNVFKVFFQPKLFTVYGINRLRNFYMANMILPVIALILASIFTSIENAALARNRQAGALIAQGLTAEQAVAEIGQTVEGLTTAPILRDLSHRLGVELPITEGVCAVLSGQSITDLAAGLMGREPTEE